MDSPRPATGQRRVDDPPSVGRYRATASVSIKMTKIFWTLTYPRSSRTMGMDSSRDGTVLCPARTVRLQSVTVSPGRPDPDRRFVAGAADRDREPTERSQP